MVGVVHSAYKVDLSKLFGLWGVTNGIISNLHGHGRVWVRGADMGLNALVIRPSRALARAGQGCGHGANCAYTLRKKRFLAMVRFFL